MLCPADTCNGWCPSEYMGWCGAVGGGRGSSEPALRIRCACSCCRCIPGWTPSAGLIAPADRWPYEPLALDDREPFTIEASEFGENRIIELMSKESE